MINEPAQTPLLDLIKSIPEDARFWYEYNSTHHRHIPAGRLFKECAEEIISLRKAIAEYENQKPIAWMYSHRQDPENTYILKYMRGTMDHSNWRETPLYIHPSDTSEKCLVKDCENHKHEGGFVGDMCMPCYLFALEGTGKHSQLYRNTQKEWVGLSADEVWELRDSHVHIMKFARAIETKLREKNA